MSCCGDHPSVEEIDQVSRLVAERLSAFLKTLRDSGFATARAEGARRLYSVQTAPLREVDAWLAARAGAWHGLMTRLGPARLYEAVRHRLDRQ